MKHTGKLSAPPSFVANYCSNAAAGASLVDPLQTPWRTLITRFSFTVVFIYEYLITIGSETQYFWGRKKTGATVLFFLNRYASLVWYVLQFASYANMSDSVSYICAVNSHQVYVLTNLTQRCVEIDAGLCLVDWKPYIAALSWHVSTSSIHSFHTLFGRVRTSSM